MKQKVSNKYRWLSVVFSVLVPGLGLVAAGKIWRGIFWFVLITLPYYIVIILFTTEKSIYYIYFLFCSIVLLWIIMIIDSWRPIRELTIKRLILFAIISIMLYFITGFLEPTIHYEVVCINGVGCMSPTLGDSKNILIKDRVVWSKTSYNTKEPERGDIILMSSNTLPHRSNSLYVKRIVALPNERVRINPPYLCINDTVVTGSPLSGTKSIANNDFVSYKLPDTNLFPTVVFHNTNDEVRLGNNEYLVMGDNGNISFDSRYFGPINRSNIIGKITAIIWPPNRICNL